MDTTAAFDGREGRGEGEGRGAMRMPPPPHAGKIDADEGKANLTCPGANLENAEGRGRIPGGKVFDGTTYDHELPFFCFSDENELQSCHRGGAVCV